MFKTQIQIFTYNMVSSFSITCASIILFLLLDIESVEARLIWIPHGKDVKVDFTQANHKMDATKRDKMVSIVLYGLGILLDLNLRFYIDDNTVINIFQIGKNQQK